MDLKILDVGSKYGTRNTIKLFSLIVQSTSDSTAAKAKMNKFLNICLLLEFIKDRWYYDHKTGAFSFVEKITL